MPLYTSGGSADFKIPEAGMWQGRCVAVIDLGTHTDPKFLNEAGKPKRAHKVQIQWELPEQMIEFEGEQRPMMVTKRYTLSHHEKAGLRKDLESWYGKKFSDKDLEQKGGFDVEKLLGRPALLNISHSDDGKFANVASINPMRKSDQEPPAITKNRFFSLASPDPEVFLTFSQKTRDFIRESEEVKLGGVRLPADPDHKAKTEQERVEAMMPENGASDSFQATDEDVPF